MIRKMMKRLLVLLWVFLCLPAAAEERLYPMLSDPLDQRIQALCVMSQRDEAFEGFPYNDGLLTIRGCMPVSIANSVIASFGVTDRETAVEIVKETANLLVFPKARGKGRVELTYLPSYLSPEERAQQADEFPNMAGTVGAYTGEVRLLDGTMDAAVVKEQLETMQAPGMLVGRMTVYPDWSEMIRLMETLEKLGHREATICITHAGAGTESSKAPLRSGDGGHYITLFAHVGTFVEEGRIYVLDSLPRAIAGEESGYTMVLRRPYPFWQEYTDFRKIFDAKRISPTVIRLSVLDKEEWTLADETGKAERMNHLIAFGPLVVTIALPE